MITYMRFPALILTFLALTAGNNLRADCTREFNGGTLDLAGQWKYAFKVEASSPDLDDSSWQTTKVPGRFGNDPTLANYKGDIWYRCKIILNAQTPENIALYLGIVPEMDEAYFNGVPVGRTGSFARNRVDIETPRLYSLPPALWREGENVLAIHVRGHSPDSGLQETVQLVNEQATARRLILRDVPAIVCSILYMLTALFFGLFFVFFRSRYEHLFFALFSLSLGLYHLIRTRLRMEMFDSFEFSYQLELVLLFILPTLFIQYLMFLLNAKRPPLVWIYTGFSGVMVLGAVLSGVGRWPITVAWHGLVLANLAGLAVAIVIIFWIVVKNYAQHRAQLRYIVYGFFALTPAIINDMIVTLKLYDFPRLTVYAFLLFLGFVTLQLANSILDLYRNLKHQEADLKLLEKKKTASILNISSEFNIISESLQRGVQDLKKSPSSSSIRGATLHLEKFVHDSRLLNLLEEDDYTIRRTRFNLKRLCEDTVQEALSVTGQQSKRILLEVPDVEILADPDLLGTALYHLVENALLYTKGRVEIAAETANGLIHLAIRDEGPGMSPELQKVVFFKFERGAHESSDIPGCGIGLAIVKLIARRLAGQVSLEGGGFFSTFRLSVPLNAEASQ
jgi:signal transduction histidine kinase